MEEASLLGAVDGVVGGVQVQHHLAQGPRVGVQEGVDEEALDGLRVVDDLAVARLGRRIRRRQLQPVERTGAGKPLRRLRLAHHRREQRVIAQRGVVRQVLVTAGDAEDALAHQLLH